MTRLNCFISESQHKDLRILAAQKRKSVGSVVREMLASKLHEDREGEPKEKEKVEPCH